MDTPVSLLDRLKQAGEQAAWARFVHLYTPLLYDWARQLGLQPSDAADLVQDVFTLLLRKLPAFEYDRGKSFRGWLRTVLLNRWRDQRKRLPAVVTAVNGELLAAAPAPQPATAGEDREYRRYLVDRSLQLLQPEFPPLTWSVFEQYVLAGRPAAEVAAQLGVSVNVVYLAKSRVLGRLRQELDGLLD